MKRPIPSEGNKDDEHVDEPPGEIDAIDSPTDLLRQAVELYRNVVEDQTEFIVRWLPDGTRTFVNESYCQYFGQTAEELIGSTFFDFIPPDDLEAILQRIAALTPENACCTGQHPVVRPDNKTGWTEWTDRAFFDRDGRLVELQSVGRDITEQKQAELALQQSEERFHKTFHASPIGITLTSMKDNRLIDVNEGWERIMEYSREEAVGKTSLSLGTWRNPEDRTRLMQKLQNGEPVQREEVEYIAKSGKEGVCEISIGGFLGVGGDRTFVTAVQDVTARKHAQEKLHKALEEVKLLRDQLEAENIYLREEIEQEAPSGGLIGNTESFRATIRNIELVAPTESTVLILGESGTGKELVAREVHRCSARSRHPLIRVNCAAIPQELSESEFFGHVKGSFTGAVRDRAGRFELANGGTIFLDEITEILPEMQSKLLRVLQEGEYERVGDEETRTTNVRVIAASNRDLNDAIKQGRFREDLYYRLSVFPIEIEPLRRRKADIPLLARHFLDIMCERMNRPTLTLTQQNIEQLQAYGWPGNVRELQNAIERSIITSHGQVLEVAIPSATDTASRSAATVARDIGFVTDGEMKRRERNNIIAALDHTKWRVFGPHGAAALLHVPATTLASRMRTLNITKPADP